MNLEVLKLIIMMCSINSLEDTNGNWTELHKIEQYQKDCRVFYIDCHKKYHNKDKWGWVALEKCIKERNPSK